MKRILVVDDEPSTGALAAEYLRLSGFETVLCEDAESALKIIASESRFDLIVLDKRMPGMSGLDLCAALKKDPATASLPVILLSASVSPSLTASEAGVSVCLSKPFSPKDLVSAVSRLLA
ncbi:MAG: response regulator [Elusimicrobia bacterium]|nr:response regulator [Elusimicrobiota bacterium]